MARMQKTVRELETGGVYLVATPIGNLEDMTFRAVKTLEMVDAILAEDTRVTKKLLQHFAIETPLLSFHEHNQYQKTEEIIDAVRQGKTYALVSDAGMPCISDPGAILVRRFIEESLPISVIPGVSASTALFSLSGMSEAGRYLFHGFLPTKEKAKREELAAYCFAKMPVIFYESPHRVLKTLQLLPELFSKETKVCIGRELTKLHETLHWFTVGELPELDLETLDTWKGEIAFIIEPATVTEIAITDNDLIHLLADKIATGMKPKAAMKELAQTYERKTSDLYTLWEQYKATKE